MVESETVSHSVGTPWTVACQAPLPLPLLTTNLISFSMRLLVCFGHINDLQHYVSFIYTIIIPYFYIFQKRRQNRNIDTDNKKKVASEERGKNKTLIRFRHIDFRKNMDRIQFSSVQSLSHVRLFATP